jgi:hypothetical protein
MKLERVTEIYDLLPTYVITLDPDPRSRGPAYLADLIAQCRNHLNAVGFLQHEVHREKHVVARDLRAHEAAFQVSFDEHLANDERVRRLPSIEDRKATVNLFLRTERQQIEDLRRILSDLEMVDKAIRHRHKELTSTMAEIKLQRSLIQDEIHTGAMYGDERIRGVSVEDPIDTTVLDEALAAAAAAMVGGMPKEPVSAPEDSYLAVGSDVSMGTGEEPVDEEPVDEEPAPLADPVDEEPAPLADPVEEVAVADPPGTDLTDDIEAFLADLSDGMGDDPLSIDDV